MHTACQVIIVIFAADLVASLFVVRRLGGFKAAARTIRANLS